MSDAVITPHVRSLTHEAAVEHPGSHQHEGEQKEDEVVMVPRTWKTTDVRLQLSLTSIITCQNTLDINVVTTL